MAFLDPLFNPLFLWLLNKSPFLGIVVLSLLITFLVTLAYKLLTDQKMMKGLKDKQKEFQKKMKELRSEPEKMMQVQKEAMATNLEYMKRSLKPTIITLLPILLVFGWMAGHLMYEPIYPGETYSITVYFKEGAAGSAVLFPDEKTTILSPQNQTISEGKAVWSLQSEEGEHLLKVRLGTIEQAKTVLITKELRYEEAVSLYEHSDITKIEINYRELKPLGTFSLFGWMPGWLGWYIMFSILFSVVLRKVMKVY